MKKVTIDQAMLTKILNWEEFLEICDESGKTLGYFTLEKLQSPFSDEEIERRSQQRTGRPLSEIMDRLKKS